MKRFAILCLVAAAAGLSSPTGSLGLVAAAQVRPGERLPASSDESKGTAVIRGEVRTTEGGPIRGALVRLFSIAPEPRLQQSSLTDANARFAFTALRPGRWLVSASKIPYLDTAYGQDVAAGRQREEIVLVDGQVVEDVVIRMPRGGVVTGRVLKAGGEPAVKATVQLMVRVDAGGRVRMTEVRAGGIRTRAETNDLGRYRIYGLPPGEYYLAVVAGSSGGGGQAPSPIYYPGVDDPSLASPVRAEADRETGGLDVVLPDKSR
jgi:hypothetical protein